MNYSRQPLPRYRKDTAPQHFLPARERDRLVNELLAYASPSGPAALLISSQPAIELFDCGPLLAALEAIGRGLPTTAEA